MSPIIVAGEMELDSLDDGEDGEHNYVSFVEISKLFAIQDAFFFGTGQIDRV